MIGRTILREHPQEQIMEATPYPKDLLMTLGRPKPREGHELDEVAFPLGGIGTGTISLTGRGRLIDWEIQNRPAKGSINAFSFFTLWAREEGKDPVAKVMAERPMRSLSGTGPGLFSGTGFGDQRLIGTGLPHMKKALFVGEYPFAEIAFVDPDIPLEASLVAYNPLIPHNVPDSSIPGAVFLFELKNPRPVPVRATVLFNMHNVVDGDLTNYNEFVEKDPVRGIFMGSEKQKPESPRWGSMGMFTTHKDVTYTRAWAREAWSENLMTFWDEVTSTGEVTDRTYPPLVGDIATLGMKTVIGPGESVTLPLYVVWSFPTMEGYWRPDMSETLPDGTTVTRKPCWTNHYALRFPDATAAAVYLAENHDRLLAESRAFRDALFSSTLPDYVLDAVSSQISTIRSTSCIVLPDGTFYSFEGCHCSDGCCEGSCTHVWNYAQTLAFLFPSLERSMREAEYRYNLGEDGRMAFRTSLPLGKKIEESALSGTAGLGELFHPAADGQMGTIMRFYRDFMLTGDEGWLREWWPAVRKSLEYAFTYWDADGDGVMEGLQHNTYDIEFYGPNTMVGSIYVGALAAASDMARRLGQIEDARRYEDLARRGAAWMDRELFNGDYYVQRIDPDADRLSPISTEISMGGQEKGQPKYQYGTGCLSDQLFGEGLARLFGIGRLFDAENVGRALLSIFRYNWRKDLAGHANPERVFATEGEPGLIICTWPRGDRPRHPLVVADEVFTGIEYQVAAHLITEGFIDEGLSIVRGARLRYDGRTRNPFNEVECGNHYVRALASWGLIIALAGFSFNAPDRAYGFNPRIALDDFRTFWSTGTGWGTFSQRVAGKGGRAELTAISGEIQIQRLCLTFLKAGYRVSIEIGSEAVAGRVEEHTGAISAVLDEPVTVSPGRPLMIAVL